MIKKAKTIAEYAILRWMENAGFQMECFQIDISGNEAIVTDKTGESIRLVYDKESHSVTSLEWKGVHTWAKEKKRKRSGSIGINTKMR